MTKKYQNNKIDTPAGDGFAVPERVSVAMGEIAGSMREGLLALAVGTGLQVSAYDLMCRWAYGLTCRSRGGLIMASAAPVG